MKNILITGATGNVGLEAIAALQGSESQCKLFAGVRNVKNDENKFSDFNIDLIKLDFTDMTTHLSTLMQADIVFLLRPPQLADVDAHFKPFIESAKIANIQHIVFLSVQGADKNKIIPHAKIEKLIIESNIPYTFLRPAYFMQNFTTVLQKDLLDKKRIFLPAGDAKFTLIDVADIGKVAAAVLTNPEKHVNQAYDLTSDEKLNFAEIADKLSKGLNSKINYISPNLVRFYWQKRQENLPTIFIFVMIMLHYLPRFQKEPTTSNSVKIITNQDATSFDKFIENNKKLLIS